MSDEHEIHADAYEAGNFYMTSTYDSQITFNNDLVWNTHWPTDIERMHMHYGFPEKIAEMDNEKLAKMLDFRIDFLQEELDELKENRRNPEEIVDALIDLCVVAIGTLDLYNVDAQKAWLEVDAANMSKETGIKEGRPNPLGLPDLMKPEGWEAPSHEGNYGLLARIVDEE